MEMPANKKKIMLAAILTSGLTLAISQASWAEEAKPGAPEPAAKAATLPAMKKMNPEMQLAHDKFLTDTTALRKELAEKNAVMRALMHADTPDITKVAQVAGELFELREKLRLKAQEAGLPMPTMMGMGMGMRDGAMPCQSMMDHGGMGKPHHMAPHE